MPTTPTPDLTRVACCQFGPRIGELAANRAAGLAAAEAAADGGAAIVVLPELSASGYVFRDSAEARALAEPADGLTAAGWAALARQRGITIVGGICELGADGLLYNTALVVDPEGVRAAYRKAHLWDAEKLLFTPGDAQPPVIETAGTSLAAMICYDLEFPEWVRLPALAGARLLCAPANWPAVPRPERERPMEVVRAQAAAAINRMFVAVCDRAGAERGVEWVGGSVIIDPDGWPLAGPEPGDHEITIAADCDLASAADKRISERNDVLTDRRPSLYGGVTSA
ncbi:MAG TPA: nitrilase-related carbon-nitrogen hydrolase [Streptosporangiaceae bacterium]|nr:nitrilase-related carbon-nitrogen hydrolase [Streptosporangiaceae bacterium]